MDVLRYVRGGRNDDIRRRRTSAFGDAPPPVQGLHILLDKAFHNWWTVCKGREPLPPGHIIPVLEAMLGHPEAPRLWAEHAD